MPDHATNSFLKKYGSKFGEIDYDTSGVKTSLGKNPQMGADGVGAASDKGLMGAGKKNSWQMGDKGVTKDGVKVSGGGMDAGAVAGGAMDAAPAVMGLIDNIGGGQFDTSAEGGGVGNGKAAILEGAGQGAQAGKAFGPWGMVIGAAVGGGISTVAHSAAQKEYHGNRQKFNVKGDALERNTREDEYRQSEGLAAMDSMQNLRKKQLGIIS